MKAKRGSFWKPTLEDAMPTEQFGSEIQRFDTFV